KPEPRNGRILTESLNRDSEFRRVPDPPNSPRLGITPARFKPINCNRVNTRPKADAAAREELLPSQCIEIEAVRIQRFNGRRRVGCQSECHDREAKRVDQCEAGRWSSGKGEEVQSVTRAAQARYIRFISQ